MMNEVQKKIQNLRKTIAEHFIGKQDAVDLMLVTIFSGGHALISGVPGIGKTYLINILARALDLSFGRVQVAQDTQPADITGYWIINMHDGSYNFIKGPIENSFVLLDEFNRANPRSKSSLLTPMQEGIIPTERGIRKVPSPHIVFATLNTIEQQGTEPLGEAERDRFSLSIEINWASEEELLRIQELVLDQKRGKRTLEKIEPVMTGKEVLEIRENVFRIKVSSDIKKYITRLVICSRDFGRKEYSFIKESIKYGSSDRAATMLLFSAMAYAFLQGKDHLSFRDVDKLIEPALVHRMVYEPGVRDIDKSEVIKRLKSVVPVVE